MKKILLFYSLASCTFAVAQNEADTTVVAAESGIPYEFDGLQTVSEYDYIPPDEAPEVISTRLQGIPSVITLSYNDKVHAFINYFTIRNRKYTRMMLRRKDLYFPIIEKYLRLYGLPDELKYLAIIESGLNPRAISRAKAVGLWQFMYATGHLYGLKADRFADDRMDPEQASDAACKYLTALYNMFGDWQLALAAYNSGPGTVRRAIRRSGNKKSFWEIYAHLPRETRAYVPQFIAAIYTLHFTDEHNLFETAREELMPMDTLQLSQSIHLETLAQLTGSCVEDIRRLNPSLLGNVIPEKRMPYVLNIPIHAKFNLESNRWTILDSVRHMAENDLQYAHYNAESTNGPMMRSYKVRRGDVLSTVAARFGVTSSEIKAWNSISRNKIRAGQTLRLYVNSPSRQTAAKTAAKTIRSTYTVQRGDTLWEIANKSGLSVQDIKQLNELQSNSLYVGQKLKLR